MSTLWKTREEINLEDVQAYLSTPKRPATLEDAKEFLDSERDENLINYSFAWK